MIDKFVFVMMIAVALFIVASRNYKRVIVAMGVFSLFASFCYLLYHAPDVAIAEAVIGSALSTILYIVALKKHRTFYIYLTTESKDNKSDLRLRMAMQDILAKIMDYCQDQELEAQTVFTHESPKQIADEHIYDLILQTAQEDKINVYGLSTEKHVQAINEVLKKEQNNKRVVFAPLEKRVEE